MAIIEDIRKTVTGSTPALAVIGATDLAVARVRSAAVQARVQKVLDPSTVQAGVQQVPALAVSRVLEVAGHVETHYSGLAQRGKGLVDRVLAQPATRDLVEQGRTTVELTRVAVKTARKAVDQTTAAALGVVTTGRTEAAEAVQEVEQKLEAGVAATEQVVAQRTAATRTAAKRTTTTARRTADGTRGAVKGAARSARKTAAKAETVVEQSAEKVGD